VARLYILHIDNATEQQMANHTVNAADYEDFDDYCAALRRLPSRTPEQELCITEQAIAHCEESRAEAITQFRSETALFGDAGPGQWEAAYGDRGMQAMRAKRDRLVRICANLETA
jgi:hypothetical protein